VTSVVAGDGVHAQFASIENEVGATCARLQQLQRIASECVPRAFCHPFGVRAVRARPPFLPSLLLPLVAAPARVRVL
jgi:hypothetical protein